ncbi:hypothetical protein AAA448_06110 [Staphylococcus equorum]
MSKEYEHLSIQDRWRIDGELDGKYIDRQITDEEIDEIQKKIEESKKDKD